MGIRRWTSLGALFYLPQYPKPHSQELFPDSSIFRTREADPLSPLLGPHFSLNISLGEASLWSVRNTCVGSSTYFLSQAVYSVVYGKRRRWSTCTYPVSVSRWLEPFLGAPPRKRGWGRMWVQLNKSSSQQFCFSLHRLYFLFSTDSVVPGSDCNCGCQKQR